MTQKDQSHLVIPTDEQINKKAAEFSGWKFKRLRELDSQMREWWEKENNPNTIRLSCPDYCKDRNMIPELIQGVVNLNCEYEFETILTELEFNTSPIEGDMTAVLLIAPRTITRAVLKAVGKYPVEWK